MWSIKVLLLFIIAGAAVGAGGDGLSSHNLGSSSLDLFRQSWLTYREVVKNDYMEHAAMTSSLEKALLEHVSSSSSVAIADVGCGDLALLASLYRKLPTLTAFTGVDLSQPALELAQGELSVLSGNVRLNWIEQDLLSWSRNEPPIHRLDSADVAPDGTPVVAPSQDGTGTTTKFDVVICAFSVHHLPDDKKQEFIKNVLQHRLNEGGIILMADVFMAPGETRDVYMDRFSTHIQKKWTLLTAEQKASILKHVLSNDFPAPLDNFLSTTVTSAGATAKVLWSESSNFEKLLLITRCSP